MALTTIQTLLAKQQAETFNSTIVDAPQVSGFLRALWKWIASHKGNPYLYVAAFSDLQDDAAVVDAACELVAVVLKKQATTTAAFYKVFNDATNDATATDAYDAVGLIDSGGTAALFYPDGQTLSAGLVHGSYTALTGSNGTTPSSSGDGPDGFVIVADPGF